MIKFSSKSKYEKLAIVVRSSSDNAERGYFKLLFCRWRQRNVQRFIMHVHRICSTRKAFVWWRSRYRPRRGFLKLLIHPAHINGINVLLQTLLTKYFLVRCGVQENVIFYSVQELINNLGVYVRRHKDSPISRSIAWAQMPFQVRNGKSTFLDID